MLIKNDIRKPKRPRRVLISCIGKGGEMGTETAQAIDQAKEEGRALGFDVRAMFTNGSSDIADMRNQLLGTAIAAEVDDLLCVDADVQPGPGSFTQIMKHNVDLVCGLYREKTDERVNYPVRWIDDGNPADALFVDPETGLPLLEALEVPAGFLRIRLHALRVMTKHAQIIRDDKKLRGISYPFLFDWTWVEENGRLKRKSEDYTFCMRAGSCGIKIWVDPSLKINHIGKKSFEGDFMAHIAGATAAAAARSNPIEAARAALAMAEAA